ncbi:MAG: acyltransferase family protein [Actinomycetota bacterium]|nr:acyltransferase family protein [Actinomycetota bacterium]
MNQNDYFRLDIQGLRGVAVLLVVIYHTGLAFPGGYIGVDMFFVISGFVITELLTREIAIHGRIDLTNFFLRRIRRLLPALFVVLTSTLFMVFFLFSPIGLQTEDGQLLGEIQEVAQTVRAASLFSTNVYFFFQSNYWALAENPLRHLWSLAVEEQFYLIFPIAVIIFIKFGWGTRSKKTLSVFLAVFVISFSGSYLLSRGIRLTPLPTRFAFFGTPWRIWEFLAGVGFAIYPNAVRWLPKKLIALILSSCGLIIFISAHQLDSFTPYPGSAALAPVLGAALLLTLGPKNRIYMKMLTASPLVKFGNISYGWYLWHWPLIVFAHRLYPQSTKVAPLAAALLAIAISAFSLKYIENPIRVSKTLLRKSSAFVGIACILLPIILSFIIQSVADTGMGLREVSKDLSQPPNFASRIGCGFSQSDLNVAEICKAGEKSRRTKKLVLLVGDSSANSASDGSRLAAESLNMDFAVYYADSCPYIARPSENGRQCEEFLNFVNQEIQRVEPEVLIISNMSDRYVSYGTQRGIVIRTADGRQPWNYSEALDIWIENLDDVLRKLPDSQKTLLLLQPPFSKFVNPSLIRPNSPSEFVMLEFSESRNLIVKRERNLVSGFRSVKAVDTASVFCEIGTCVQYKNGKPLYTDDRHLSSSGSELMVELIRSGISELVPGN